MLPDTTRKRIEAEAAKRGVDLKAALAEAERLAAKDQPAAESDGGDGEPEQTGRPVADRLLIGFLPFIKVRELRTHWLGLPESIPDDEMMCGEFAAKYGGSAGTAAPSEDPDAA